MLFDLASIPFPGIDPVLFRVGPVAIRWYGIAYMLGFFLGYLALRRLIRQGQLRLTTDQLSNLLSWIVGGVLIGGRLGWWFIYNHGTSSDWPWYEPLAIWRGGMSFHGGLIGVALSLFIWTRRNHVSYWMVADAAALVVPIGLFFGRIANFINAELVGRVTTVPWAIIFPGDSSARHPSQLYEAILEGPILLLLLRLIQRLFPVGSGRLAASFLVLYGMIRFVVEFTREPDTQIGFIAFGWMTMGQALSAAIAAVGFVLLQIRQTAAHSLSQAATKIASAQKL